MKNRDIDNMVASGLAKTVPDNAYERILAALPTASQTERKTILMKKKNNILRFVLPAACACLILVAGIFGFVHYDANYRVDSVIDIDVNPGIELSTNKKDRVLEAVAINDDAEDILDGMDLKDTELKVAVNAIIGSMVQKGYVTDEMSSILVTVKNRDSGKADTLRAEVVRDIDAALLSQGINAPVINQTLTDSDDVEAFAKKHGISFGKAVFVKNIASKIATISADELAKLSISELTEIVVKNNIDISDIADYDHDDSIWENIHESIDEVDEDKADQDMLENGNVISQQKAKQIALDDAGVAESEASFSKASLERDDGVVKYDVEFHANGVEYEYDIAADDGTIINFKKKYTDKYVQPSIDDKPKDDKLTPNEAKQKALSHAGLAEEDVRGFKIELDRDDGREVYEIEFNADGYEYEYEIDAKDGDVIKSDKEYDD